MMSDPIISPMILHQVLYRSHSPMISGVRSLGPKSLIQRNCTIDQSCSNSKGDPSLKYQYFVKMLNVTTTEKMLCCCRWCSNVPLARSSQNGQDASNKLHHYLIRANAVSAVLPPA